MEPSIAIEVAPSRLTPELGAIQACASPSKPPPLPALWRQIWPPDPGEPATFLRSRLNHTLGGAPRHRELREYYRHWLTLRRRHPALGARGTEHARAELDAKGAVLTLTRGPENGPRVRVVANLTRTAIPLEKQPEGWLVLLDSNDTQFAGTGTTVPLQPFQLLLYEARG